MLHYRRYSLLAKTSTTREQYERAAALEWGQRGLTSADAAVLAAKVRDNTDTTSAGESGSNRDRVDLFNAAVDGPA